MDSLFQKLMLGGSTAALMAAMPIAGAMAQGGNDIEQVVVSASRITIAGYTQPTPVTVVGSAQLEKDAFANITDAVRELPQVNAPPSTYSTNAGGGGPGSAGENILNLRNLGTTRTLVLFDNQRVVASNISGGVDIGTLPSALVQRIDVVTGGASAAWGSDAVAGVVNFVLNKNFDGFKANIQAGDAYNGLNRSISGQFAWGGDVFGGRGHFIVAASANISPDATPVINENWFRGIYWVSNPSYTAGSSAPQLIIANDVGLAVATTGGIITASPAVTAANSPSGVATTANVLRGIEFVGDGIPQLVNFGNVTLGALSNGGSLTDRDSDTILELAALPSRSYNFFAFGRYKLTDTIQASLQLNYGTNFSKSRTSSSTQTAIVIASDNAYIPASVRATMQTSGITSFTMGEFVENNFNNYAITGSNYIPMAEGALGPTVLLNGRELMRGVFSLDGTLGDDWSWNAYYEHSTSNVYIHSTGNNINANINAAEDAVTVTTANRGTSTLPLGSIACRSSLPGQKAVVNGGITAQAGCVPLDLFGLGVASANTIRYISDGNLDFEDMLLNQDVAEGSVQGTLPWSLPAGKVAVVFGAGYRKEANRVNATAIGSQAGFAVANYSNFPAASYNIEEGFAEVDAPLLKDNFVNSLDFSAAGRITSYSTSGMVETWKLGLTSQVTDDFRLRTTWSVDIRAPILAELFSPGANNGATARDPKSQATVSIFTTTTGNPNLVPEVARTISGGIVLTPHWVDGLNMSVDWYSINLTGAVATVGLTTILNQCNASLPSTIYPGTQGNPNDPLCTHLIFNASGALTTEINSPINFASQTTSGMDIQANYNMDFWEGSLAWSAIANLNDESTSSQPGTPTNDSAGSGGQPKWKGIVSAAYTAGPYSVTVQGRWFGTNKYSNTANTGNLSSSAVANLYDPNGFELPFVAYLDLRGSYKWNDNIQIYGAVDNATNVPPPMFPSVAGNVKAQGSLTTTVPQTYDMLGRYLRLGIRFSY
jgi:outer membrane receptor protein involved in Fe transport